MEMHFLILYSLSVNFLFRFISVDQTVASYVCVVNTCGHVNND